MTHVHALLEIAGPMTEPSFIVWLLFTLVKLIVVFTVYMIGVALLTLAERKISAWMQDRHGPNRVGKGWLQPVADGVKNFVKEETYPAAANRYPAAVPVTGFPARPHGALRPVGRMSARRDPAMPIRRPGPLRAAQERMQGPARD